MIAQRPMSRNLLRVRFGGCILLVMGVFAVLVGRLAFLQVVQGDRYRNLSESNRIRLERLSAPRGMILDRNGEILADVRASFDAVVVPMEAPQKLDADWMGEVADILGQEPDGIRRVVEGPGPARWKPRILARRLDRTQVARLEAHRLELSGVRAQAIPVRHYPFDALLGHVLGYVGEVGAAELRQPAYAEYESGDALGRTGLEWAWEGTLRGEAGGQQVEVDVRGRQLSVLASRPARPGRNVRLSIDRRLQRAAEDALGDRTGAVAVLEVATGDVLALASAPPLDPNRLTRGITPSEWRGIVEDPRHPMQNRAIRGQYPPGSTFKVAMALAGLAEGVITPRTQVYCGGGYTFAGRKYRCWKAAGHGWVDLEKALTESCDVYFYQLGLDLGVDTIHRWVAELGLGKPTGIDLPGEKAGLVPTKRWKRRSRGEPWYAGETLSVSIGQGYVLTTPLQLASMMAAVAHPRGVRMRPRIVTRIEDWRGVALRDVPPREAGVLPFRRIQLDRVRSALREVVAGEHGTARKAEVDGYPLAGKTGTAQVVKLPVEKGVSQDKIPWKHRDHALFVGFAPYDDPVIAFAVVVEHGGHGGSAAGPVAKSVVEAWRDLERGGLAAGEEGGR